MAKNKNTNGAKNQPAIKSKAGIFQLASWDGHSTCLTGGVRNKGEWENIKIWFPGTQFGNLELVVEEFKEQLKEFFQKQAEKVVSE